MWISWANVHFRGGYLGQMCILMVDILGKCVLLRWISWANVLCILVVDILGKCAFSWWISWANVHSRGGYLGQMCITMVNICLILKKTSKGPKG